MYYISYTEEKHLFFLCNLNQMIYLLKKVPMYVIICMLIDAVCLKGVSSQQHFVVKSHAISLKYYVLVGRVRYVQYFCFMTLAIVSLSWSPNQSVHM